MSTAVDHSRREHRRRAERQAMDKLTERLASQFPELSPERITQVIHGHYAEFDRAPIREFVPILVERAAKDDLTPRG